MGLVSRIAAPAAAVFGCSLLVACGGSVADSDSDSRSESSRSSAAPSAFCVAARASSEAIRPLNGLASGGPRPADLPSTVDQVRRTGVELLRVSPDEIRSDVERTTQAVNLQLDVLIANGGDVSALSRDPELMAKLSSPDLAGAGERYRLYVNRTCNQAVPRSTG